MKVLLVGASGVVGRQLVPQFVGAGHSVTATSRSRGKLAGSAESQVDYRSLDLLDPSAVQHIVVDVEPDVIIHQATALRELGNNIRRFDELFSLTNRLRTEGTGALLTAAQEVGSPRLLAQSFCGWPWAQVGGPVKTEEDPFDDNPPKAFRKTFTVAMASTTSSTTTRPQSDSGCPTWPGSWERPARASFRAVWPGSARARVRSE